MWRVGNKLCEDGKKYGTENTCTSGSTLLKAALSFTKARSMMEKERGNLLKALGTQVWTIVCFYTGNVSVWIRGIMEYEQLVRCVLCLR